MYQYKLLSSLKADDFLIDSLGKAELESPLHLSVTDGDDMVNYVPDDERILIQNTIRLGTDNPLGEIRADWSFERAGPREKIYFNPETTTCGIVTCGGICPGINNVIRALVMHLYHSYGVKKILGFKHGYQGLVSEFWHTPVELDPRVVRSIHNLGGTFLGTSRGNQDPKKMVDTLERFKVDCLFTIGGDGTLRGAQGIYEEIKRRGLNISVIGIPKTIDNDLIFVDRTFGFETAFSEAARAIRSANTEAEAAANGIGIVKLMGRHSGYVAAYAALALKEVNLVLVPEQKFSLERIYHLIEDRLKRKGDIVIVVAEGAGQDLLNDGTEERDASGNMKLKDIGLFLKESITQHFKKLGQSVDIKYIDPSYMIRSAPAYPTDSVFTGSLGYYAADAAMRGKTGLILGRWRGTFTHVPIQLAVSARNVISLESELWMSVLRATGQPASLI